MNTPNCVLTPSADEGPYFVDERLLRPDIRTDAEGGPPQEGVPLALTLRVVEAGGDCPPVQGAHVDIWHCNAQGTYSDEPAEGTVGRTFLRGCQVSDADGDVQFATIFPGWYAGRAVHIHLKVRLLRKGRETYDFTTQLFFDEALIDEIHVNRPPYDARGRPQVANPDDYIFEVNGPQLMLSTTAERDGGYRASMVVGLSGIDATSTQ